MKKILTVLSLLLITKISTAQGFTGDWYGKLDVGIQRLTIVFHVAKTQSGSYTTTMDSPDQKVFGLATDTTIITGDSVYVSYKKLQMVYTGKLLGDTAIHGTFTQGMAFKLNLSHTKIEAKEKKRPQTPRPLFSYNVKDTIYFNANKSIQYGATITYPKSSKKSFPLLILITGSGPQDRDETLFDHKPFAVIADYLTKLGYTVLRVDDRSIGKTTGDFAKSTAADFAQDVLAGIVFAKTLPFVNKSQIGLLGHSEGGLIAPMVAAQSKDVAFIVSLAGVGMRGKELLMKQNEDIMVSTGEITSREDAKLFANYLGKLYDIVVTEKDANTSAQKAETAFYDWKKTIPGPSLKSLELDKDSAYIKQLIGTLLSQLQLPSYKYFIQSNAADHWRRVTVPVLAINGEKDLQVAANENLQTIKNAVRANGNKKITTIVLPGLNHLFQTCIKCTISEYSELEETIAPQALKTIGDWLLKNVRP